MTPEDGKKKWNELFGRAKKAAEDGKVVFDQYKKTVDGYVAKGLDAIDKIVPPANAADETPDASAPVVKPVANPGPKKGRHHI